MKVAVFIGHGLSADSSWDSGCTYKGYTEAELMKPITESCVYYLRACGIEVITDAPANRMNMIAQVAKSNDSKVKLHVAFHCDYDKSPSGTFPLYYSDNGRKLAKQMNKYVLKYSSLKTRGLKRRTDLYELSDTSAPSVIFECGSIKRDLKTMIREFDAIGFGAARGICSYLGVPFRPIQMRLLNALTFYEKKIVKNKFTYNGKATYTTYLKAYKGKRQLNCALFVTWALQKIGVLPNNRRIWLGNGVNGNGAATLKKKCKVMHPNKRWYRCGLHIGDVCGWQWGSSKKNLVHTMVLRGFDKNRPIWATAGSSDVAARDLSRMRSTYERKPIKTICRLK